MSDDDLRVAEEQREALDSWRGHPWFADERDPDEWDDLLGGFGDPDDDEDCEGGGGSPSPRPPTRDAS